MPLCIYLSGSQPVQLQPVHQADTVLVVFASFRLTRYFPPFPPTSATLAALNVQTLAALHGNREEEMAAMLYWQYLASCVTLPAALTFFLWLLHTPTMSI